MADYGDWFKTDAIWMRWLEASPIKKVSRCDRVWGHLVPADTPRLQVDSLAGPDRKRGKGTKAEYLCSVCALKDYELVPPSPLYTDQDELF